MVLRLTREQQTTLQDRVAAVAFSPDEMKDGGIAQWYEGWNAAVKAVGEVLSSIILTKEDPAC